MRSTKILPLSIAVSLLSTSTILSSMSAEAALSLDQRVVQSTIFPSGTFSSGKGLNFKGSLPENATAAGVFMIPNGASMNPGLTDETEVVFKNVGGVWTPYSGNVALTGASAPAYFPLTALNPDSGPHMKISGDKLVLWEDLYGGGDADFDDVEANVVVQDTTVTGKTPIIPIGGNLLYNIDGLNKVRVNVDSIVSNAGYNNSIGHFFLDSASTPISGKIDFANVKDTLGVGNPSVNNYQRWKPFASGSTLQFRSPTLAVADLDGVVVRAVDVSPVAKNTTPVLLLNKSASVGSTVNTSPGNNNNLYIRIAAGNTLTLDGRSGAFFDGSSAGSSDYSGLSQVRSIGNDNATVILDLPTRTTINADFGGGPLLVLSDPILSVKPLISDLAVAEVDALTVVSTKPIPNALHSLKISGASVELTKTLSTYNIEFTNPDATRALILSGPANIGNANIISAAKKRLHSVHVVANQTFTGQVGSLTNPLGTIKFLKDNTIQINTGSFYTDVSTANDGMGTLVFNPVVSPVFTFAVIKGGSQTPFAYSVGDTTNSLKEIIFNTSGEIRGSTYANRITLEKPSEEEKNPVEAFFKQRTAVDGGIVRPIVSTKSGIVIKYVKNAVTFDDLAKVYGGSIRGINPHMGRFYSLGSIEMYAPIGMSGLPMLLADFQANSLDKKVLLDRNITADEIIFHKSDTSLLSGLTMRGNATFTDTSINVDNHILVFSDGAQAFKGSPVIKTRFDRDPQGPNGELGAYHNGHMTASTGAKMTFVNVSTMKFVIDDRVRYSPNVKIYKFFRTENGGQIQVPFLSQVVAVETNNPLYQWEYLADGTLKRSVAPDGVTALVKAITGSTASASRVKSLFPTSDSGAAVEFANDLSLLYLDNPAAAADALNRVVNAPNPTNQVAILTQQSLQSSITASRVNTDLVTANSEDLDYAEGDAVGIAAGDDSRKYGIWAEPFYNISHQKVRANNEPGHKSHGVGGTVGVDGKINEDVMLGFSGTFIDTKVKYKDSKDGDKSTIDSTIISLYGLYNLVNDWFVQGIGSFGYNRVKNNKIRITATSGISDVSSKYTARTYGLEVLGGYNYYFDRSLVLTPTLGARYDRFFGNKYYEKGNFQTLYVNKKSFNNFNAVLGLKLAKAFNLTKAVITPDIHVSMNQKIADNNGAVSVLMDGSLQPSVVTAGKSPRSSYKAGIGLKAERGMMEYGASYDLQMASKFVGQQGAVKIKMHF